MLIRTLAGLALSFGFVASAQAAPALWKVSDGDSSIYLFGSVHMLKPSQDWHTPLIDKVKLKADRVYFETDISPEGMTEAAQKSMLLGFNTDGRLLSEMISPEVLDQLRVAATEYNVPMSSLLAMKPWMAATTISAAPMLQSGYEQAYGVEAVLSNGVEQDRVGQLETIDEQLNLLISGDEAADIALLEATLETLDEVNVEIEALTAAWLRGDVEAVGDIFDEQMVYEEEMLKRLIDDRNANWAEQVTAMLERNEKAFLVVGAGHLAGPASLVTMLENKGFSSERLQ